MFTNIFVSVELVSQMVFLRAPLFLKIFIVSVVLVVLLMFMFRSTNLEEENIYITSVIDRIMFVLDQEMVNCDVATWINDPFEFFFIPH